MLEFKTPQIEDKAWVDQCFKHLKTMNCDYTFGNMFVWSTEYSTKICRFKDFFICSWGMGKETNFGIPVGKGDFKEAVEEVIKYAKANDIMPRFYGVTEAYVVMLNENFPDAFQFLYDESYGDYIYEVEKMASLKGKKYHGKRNHISAFSKQYDWRYAALTAGNVNDIRQCANEWYAENEARADKYLLCEKRGVEIMLQNAAALKIRGGIIYIGEKAVAFTLGSAVNRDVFDIHIEKSLAEYAEGYTVINREFAANELADYKYINREDDMGLDGLRQAKLSYHPAVMVKKYSAVKKVTE